MNQINKEKDDKAVKKGDAKAQDFEISDVKFNLPQRPEEWVNYMIPKDFLERIRSTENSDIMNKLTFEKAEQTYFCLNYVIKTLESMGHQLHCLEMYAFLRFFVKEILNAPSQAQTLVECKYSRYLNSIGLVNEGNQLYQGLTFNKFFPSEAEERDLIARVQASVVETKNKKSEGTMHTRHDTAVTAVGRSRRFSE